MNPVTSIWYGVDPLTEKYPNVSGYCYTFGNPIRMVDLTGMGPEDNPKTPTKKEKSANISIELAPNNMLKITIFNITSLTSGAFGKEAFGEEYYPKSYMRVPGKRTPYGNISQTFHLLIQNPNK